MQTKLHSGTLCWMEEKEKAWRNWKLSGYQKEQTEKCYPGFPKT